MNYQPKAAPPGGYSQFEPAPAGPLTPLHWVATAFLMPFVILGVLGPAGIFLAWVCCHQFGVLKEHAAERAVVEHIVVEQRAEAKRVWEADAPARDAAWAVYCAAHNAKVRATHYRDDDTHISGGRNDGYGTYYSTEEPTVGYGGKRFTEFNEDGEAE